MRRRPNNKIHTFVKKICLLLALLLAEKLAAQTPAQPPALTPDEAVRLALEANYDIRIVRGDAEIARLNNTRANAGMLPVVNFVASDNASLNSFQQKLANGSEFSALGAPFNTASAGVQLSWTLFDGGRMSITKNRLEQLEALGQINLQAAVLQTAAAVLTAYYDIVRARLQIRASEELITLNSERLRIAEARLTAGMAAQTDALQAKVDLNQRKSDLLNQQNTLAAAKRTLNRLLVRPPETAFEVVENLASNYAPDAPALLQKMLAQNPGLLSLQKSTEVAALTVDEAHTLNRARLTGIGQFNAVRSDNGSGFLLNNTQAGLTVGASLVIPLYTGGNAKRQVDVAKVAAQQSQFRLENQRTALETELSNQLAFFQTQREVLALENDNIANARESLNVSTERFRLGQTNALEVQSAQNNLEQALTRQNLVEYNLKMAELQLRLLAGEI